VPSSDVVPFLYQDSQVSTSAKVGTASLALQYFPASVHHL
jgi:hypothetical protein